MNKGQPNSNNNNNKRSRGRGGSNNNGPKKHQPRGNQTFDSNGPEIRIRGNAHQVLEKYLALARDASAQGDRIAAENYYQHAEHYFRVINSMNGGAPRRGAPTPAEDQMIPDDENEGEGDSDGNGGDEAQAAADEAEEIQAESQEAVSA